MRIAILTFFESANYGTVLQAYALKKYLEINGYEAEIVHIKRDFNSSSIMFKKQPRKFAFLQRVKIKLLAPYIKKCDKMKQAAFKNFRDEFLNVSERFYDKEEDLVNDFTRYDVYLSGGDQIWNPYHKVFSTHYLWDFIPDTQIKISYSSSFGVENIEEIQTFERVKALLKGYKRISVREKSGVKIINSMGLDADEVLDPIFLIRDEWLSLVKPIKKEKYCLVYSLVEYPIEENKTIERFAKKNNLEVIILPNNNLNCLNGFKKHFSSGPIEFLSLIQNAEHVFTNSFHGLAFSILFNKQFTVLSVIGDENLKKRTRLNELLDKFSIFNRDIDNVENKIDYNSINDKMQVLIENSKLWLNETLQNKYI